MAFFVSADDQVYGRYGGRDPKGAETRLTLPGLRFAMQAALDAHRKARDSKQENPAPNTPVFAEGYNAAKKLRGKECIHCHQVYEFRRADAKAAGTFNRDSLWVYPLPENIGITLDLDQGNKIKSVAAGSSAEKAGLRAGDILATVNGVTVHSFADVQYGLNRAPARGQISIGWERDNKPAAAQLDLPDGWRRTNPT